MAVTAFWYAQAFINVFDKEIDYLADAMNVQLHTSAYTPNQDTHDYANDATNEVTAGGLGYATGGLALGTKVNTNTLNVVNFGAANTVWTFTGAGHTARRAVLLDSTPGTAATNPLMTWIDFGVDETASGGGTFTIAWAGGIIASVTPTDATGFP